MRLLLISQVLQATRELHPELRPARRAARQTSELHVRYHHQQRTRSFRVSASPLVSRPTPRHCCCEAQADSSRGSSPARGAPQSKSKVKSIVCAKCEGNGAILCTQCHGEGLNSEDHFNGRFKAGTICWLCRGKKQILCGECNGAGFFRRLHEHTR